jgi:hypothetical protein
MTLILTGMPEAKPIHPKAMVGVIFAHQCPDRIVLYLSDLT